MTELRGREAQCPLCGRIFGSDSTCERHKPYARPVTRECKDPASIGLESRERRGRVVWVAPMAPEAVERRIGAVGGRRAVAGT